MLVIKSSECHHVVQVAKALPVPPSELREVPSCLGFLGSNVGPKR
jgi:hypothetical protein